MKLPFCMNNQENTICTYSQLIKEYFPSRLSKSKNIKYRTPVVIVYTSWTLNNQTTVLWSVINHVSLINKESISKAL